MLGIPLRFGIGYGLPVTETIPLRMNRMATGIIGGPTAEALLTATDAAV